MNCSLTNSDRGYNISLCDGFTSLVTGLSGVPYSMWHWNLSNQCELKYSIGHRIIAILEGIPIVGALASLIERVVVCVYNKYFITQTFRYVEPPPSADFNSYSKLNQEMKVSEFTLEVTDKTGGHRGNYETTQGILGTGGCKKAIGLAKGRALLLPNMDADSIPEVAKRWGRIVEEEVAMSAILTSIGLLSPSSTRVMVFPTSEMSAIPAYISRTFRDLEQTEGLFILDRKNPRSSTWKRGTHYLFHSDEERFIDKNWDSIVDLLLTDIAKLCMYDIPVKRDSLNIAIAKKSSPSDEKVSQYEVRYFGFDFSSKTDPLAIPMGKRSRYSSSYQKSASNLLHELLDPLFFSEFGHRYDGGKEKKSIHALKNRLVERYTPKILSKLHELHNETPAETMA